MIYLSKHTLLTYHPGFISGTKYSYPEIVSSSNRIDGAYADNLYFNYIYLPNKILKYIYFTIFSGFIDGAKVQVGIYSIKDGLPDRKLISTEITITSNGEKQITLDLLLEEGWYAIAYYSTHTQRIPAVTTTTTSNTTYLYGISSGFQTGLRFLFPYQILPNIFNFNSYTRQSCDRSPVVYFEY